MVKCRLKRPRALRMPTMRTGGDTRDRCRRPKLTRHSERSRRCQGERVVGGSGSRGPRGPTAHREPLWQGRGLVACAHPGGMWKGRAVAWPRGAAVRLCRGSTGSHMTCGWRNPPEALAALRLPQAATGCLCLPLPATACTRAALVLHPQRLPPRESRTVTYAKPTLVHQVPCQRPGVLQEPCKCTTRP